MCQECETGAAPHPPRRSPTRRRLIGWGLTVPAAAAVSGLSAATPALAHDVNRGSAFYMAKSGDTLRAIAARFLGNDQRWTEILGLNADELGPDGQPRAGQRLLLPESPDGGHSRTFAPLPVGARPRPVPPEGYRLERIGPSAYGVIVGAAQSVFVVTSTGVVVIDSPGSFATALPAAIKRITDKPVTHVIYSHSHWDHIGSADRFPGAVRVAHAETKAILVANADPSRPVPTVTFTDRYTLVVGDEKFLLSYPGPNHESGNIIIQVPDQHLAIMIDVVLPGVAPYRAFGTADSVPGLLRAHRELLTMDFDLFVGGHWYRWGTRRDVQESSDFVTDMWNETAAAIAAIPQAGFFAKVEPGNAWAALDLWFDALADRVEPIILPRWIRRLGAVDVFTRENVKIMAHAQRVDQPHDL